MKKKFNITGTCIPERHFMCLMTEKLDKIAAMVADGDYFTINRPRQYGKTTLIYLLQKRLQQDENYLAIDISFESIDTPTYENHPQFIASFLKMLRRRLEFMDEKVLAAMIKETPAITDFSELNAFITDFIIKANRKVVLMIDEVDKSTNNQLFLDFLGMLRTKFLKQKEGKDYSFFSVILAGVHDIKTLKTKIRTHDIDKKTYNSPWNIAVNFKVKLELSPAEIATILEDYAAEQKVKIDIPLLAEELYYLTSGYPFLVSDLCKIIDEEILPGKEKKEWLPPDLKEAVKIALKEDSTNFESLIKNLENNGELYELVFQLIMNQKEFSYNPRNPLIHLGTVYGILREEGNKTRIHNRVYEQLLYDYMSSKLETSADTVFGVVGDRYVGEKGTLNMEKIIRKFQEFMKEQYSQKDAGFIERNGRLLFLAFIKPIINGRGFDFKEVQVSEEKRLDVVITFEKQKYIVELKIWHGESYHREGLKQLADYLDRQNQNVGYLLIYDLRKEKGKMGDYETIDVQGKQVFAAWV